MLNRRLHFFLLPMPSWPSSLYRWPASKFRSLFMKSRFSLQLCCNIFSLQTVPHFNIDFQSYMQQVDKPIIAKRNIASDDDYNVWWIFLIAEIIINNTTTICATTTTLHNIITTTTMATMINITTTALTMVIQAESLSLGERNYSRLVGPNGPLVKYFVLVEISLSSNFFSVNIKQR